MRPWQSQQLKPHRTASFKLCSDPHFLEELTAVVGLCLNPPAKALVLCIDKKSPNVEHFNDLCQMLRLPTPLAADPTGNDFFCFQKLVAKDAELSPAPEPGEAAGAAERGFADVWKRGCFAWEYKGKRKNLDDAHKQLLRYRESLENPPLLVVCDLDRFIIRTNFNGTVQETHEFTNSQIDNPKILKLLRDAFTDPDFLRPQRTTARVTEELAGKIAAVARSLQGRESVELEDAFTRRELRVAQRKNLRIARFGLHPV